VVDRVADDQRAVLAHADAVRLPERRVCGQDSVARIDMMLATDTGDGPDRAMHRVDGSNDIVLTFHDVQDTCGTQRDAAGTVKGCFQRIAAVARVTLPAGSSHSMDQAGPEFQAPHAVTGDRCDPNIVTSNC
jgi:hypothetical protein